MDPYEAIISKRDVRHYTADPIAPGTMHRLLQAARMAGSAKNQEANRLLLIEDQSVQDALAEAGDFSSWIGTSTAIVGFATPVEFSRAFDVGRQAQNLMVAAHAEGLATCPVTMHRQDQVRAALGLPEDWQMDMVVTVGWPAPDRPESPLKRQRVALDELVRKDRWS